ncbi:putative bifunctional diguanylate cyclase/phosphodiesterase [Clostridium cellulovorans]|uniref:Diguanylate cyclase/phosphodiesterase n=1 Tax=Clostridium cellulovorans (strain ATCC 35296 / DSM 3052 / OCM 3 / 743B) TaxID=573061 RepID=D9SQZ8_CLOC7|nr:EAL domain-containing protein [Clostridium cellulovorans]ADL50286.1 diguanylate cyclase/phosphodiesterase [Clostridium cellulovorans 743B]
MEQNSTNMIERYLDDKTIQLESKKYRKLKIFISIILFLTFSFLQRKVNGVPTISGIFAQLQVLVSIYLAIKASKASYITAVLLNLFGISQVMIAIFLLGNVSAVTGVIVYSFNIISITIIWALSNRNVKQFKRVLDQREDIIALYEELSASEEELRDQNRQLMDYNEKLVKQEEELTFLAHYDTLSGLPNRKMIKDTLEKIRKNALENESSFAVVLIDLDDFKKINDTMGHHIGDTLLQAVAERLIPFVKEEDILGRMGGDEFALVIQSQYKEDIFQYLEQLRNNLNQDFNIDGNRVRTCASFGVALFPQDSTDDDELMKYADTAMYKVKATGKNNICFFKKEMNDEVLERTEFEKRLLTAMEEDELFLVFQPQYRLDPLELRGFEVLVRWKSPDMGMVSPMKFIPLAEEMGLIVKMGEWILRTACKKFKALKDKYSLDSMISVNISAVQIQDEFFVDIVKSALEESGLEGKYLELEITESVLIESIDKVIGVFEELKKLGVHIALDDFGTGYSSLSYLQRLPIDTLKIDKSFLNHQNTSDENKDIIGGIIFLMHRMGIYVIMEGVEEEFQLNYLKHRQCDCIQGFLLGKPLDEPTVEELLKK